MREYTTTISNHGGFNINSNLWQQKDIAAVNSNYHNMKIHLKFNHQKNDVLEAIDSQYDVETVNDMIHDLIRDYLLDDDMNKQSQLCELIHNRLDYEAILFIAMHSILDRISSAKTNALKEKLKKFLEDEDI